MSANNYMHDRNSTKLKNLKKNFGNILKYYKIKKVICIFVDSSKIKNNKYFWSTNV